MRASTKFYLLSIAWTGLAIGLSNIIPFFIGMLGMMFLLIEASYFKGREDAANSIDKLKTFVVEHTYMACDRCGNVPSLTASKDSEAWLCKECMKEEPNFQLPPKEGKTA